MDVKGKTGCMEKETVLTRIWGKLGTWVHHSHGAT